MQKKLLNAILFFIIYAVLPTYAYISGGSWKEDIPICDTREERIQKYNEQEYYVCQKMPTAIGQKENNKGIWIHWGCDDASITFNVDSCKPILEGAVHDPEMKPLMDQLMFCNEEQTNTVVANEYAKSGPSCALENAPLIAEMDDKRQYYQCLSIKPNKLCGQWNLKVCEDKTVFDNYMQKCVTEEKAAKSKGDLRIGYMPYAGAYAAAPYGYGYGYPALPMMPYAAPAVRPFPYPYFGYMAHPYPYMAGGIPAPYGGQPMHPYYAGFPMGGLNHYYLSMYPWMYPGIPPYGMPVRVLPGANQGGGGRAPTAGGGGTATGGGGGAAGGGGAGGGVAGGGGGGGGIPGLNKLPGANKLPGLSGGGGSKLPGIGGGGGSKLPGIGGGSGSKLPGIGGGGGIKLPGANKLPGVG